MKLQKCNGFLEAMALLNSAPSDCYAEFYLIQLPSAGDLKGALALHYENYIRENHVVLRDGRLADDWQIDTLEVSAPEELLTSVCKKWFFCSDHMRTAPHGTHRSNLVQHFLDEMELAMGPGLMHRVYITPPCWYAIDWDELAYEHEGQRFLLHFDHSN